MIYLLVVFLIEVSLLFAGGMCIFGRLSESGLKKMEEGERIESYSRFLSGFSRFTVGLLLFAYALVLIVTKASILITALSA